MDNWHIYVERSQDGQVCRFGVFCGSRDPSSLTVDEVLLDSFDEGFPIVKIIQSARNKVDVRTSKGNAIEFHFNDDADVIHLLDHSHISSLAHLISHDITDDIFCNFVDRLLVDRI
jgi:hypothetical protein